MANVKFNRGTVAGLANLGSNPFDQVTLVRDTATAGSTDYNSIYLGTALVGTSMLGLMSPSKLRYKASDDATNWSENAVIGTTFASGVITTDVVNSNPVTTVRKLVDYATANPSTGTYTAQDCEILTAKATASLITSAGGYYTDGSGDPETAGGWAYNQTSWNTWTAVHSIDPTHKSIAFTLPIAVTSGDNYNPATDSTHLVTPEQVVDFIGANDIYHKSGTSGTNGWSGWTWTADAYKGSTLLTDQTTPAASTYALSFTIPVHTYTDASTYAADNTTLTTPYQVAQYLSTVAGAMEYKGELTNAMATGGTGTHSAYKPGDVFIVGHGGIQSLDAEDGDMVIVNTAIAEDAAFSSDSNCDVFERNITGAVTAENTFTQNAIIYSDGTSRTTASASHITVDTANTDLVIEHTVGQTTHTVSVADALIWHEL